LIEDRLLKRDEIHYIVSPFIRFPGTAGVHWIAFVPDMNNSFADQDRHAFADNAGINI
jgi:hypothetical protein